MSYFLFKYRTSFFCCHPADRDMPVVSQCPPVMGARQGHDEAELHRIDVQLHAVSVQAERVQAARKLKDNQSNLVGLVKQVTLAVVSSIDVEEARVLDAKVNAKQSPDTLEQPASQVAAVPNVHLPYFASVQPVKPGYDDFYDPHQGRPVKDVLYAIFFKAPANPRKVSARALVLACVYIRRLLTSRSMTISRWNWERLFCVSLSLAHRFEDCSYVAGSDPRFQRWGRMYHECDVPNFRVLESVFMKSVDFRMVVSHDEYEQTLSLLHPEPAVGPVPMLDTPARDIDRIGASCTPVVTTRELRSDTQKRKRTPHHGTGDIARLCNLHRDNDLNGLEVQLGIYDRNSGMWDASVLSSSARHQRIQVSSDNLSTEYNARNATAAYTYAALYPKSTL